MPGSQAYHDVLHRLRSQYPFVHVIEVGVSVQGDGAGDEIAMAIDIVNRLTDADVILLTRGGGAPEELAAFNDERLARAIFASGIPVVTGVGHETDHTIVDFVADRRAATPSLAAAVAVPDLAAVMQQIGQLHARLTDSVNQRLRHERQRWVQANRALLRSSPQNLLGVQRQRADELARGMERNVQLQLREKRERLASLQARLQALDPLAILARGYAVLTDTHSGEVVSRVAQAASSGVLRARVSDGEFRVRVEG
jgi:exodeoxyribonuclease VII large subunit